MKTPSEVMNVMLTVEAITFKPLVAVVDRQDESEDPNIYERIIADFTLMFLIGYRDRSQS